MTALSGTTRVDITPDKPIMMAGFGQRTKPCTGVHDPIFGKAVYSQNDEERLLFIAAELSG